MRRVAGQILALTIVALVTTTCSALGPPEITAEQRAWCRQHQVPDLPGEVSVASAARQLSIASPDVLRALETLEATLATGVPLAEAVVLAEIGSDGPAATEARAAYDAWKADVAEPARETARAVLDGWSATPEWSEACATAWDGRAPSAATTAPGSTGAPAATAPAASPTPAPTPAPTPRLAANGTIHYTSSTYVGRLIELTIRVRNPGSLRAGRVSVQVEADGYALRSRTPVVGCIPDCRSATGAEGIGYVEWAAPAPGAAREYTVQLKAKRAGTYRIRVRVYHGPAEDPGVQLASWTVRTRVR